MKARNEQRARMLSWLSVAALMVLCTALAVLQYQWTGEVSVAERDRLRDRLQADLWRVREDFNSEITAAAMALMPEGFPEELSPADYAIRFQRWRETSRHSGLIARAGVVVAENQTPVLHLLDGALGTESVSDEWPAEWAQLREDFAARLSPEPWRVFRPGLQAFHGSIFLLPRFRRPSPNGPPGPFPLREASWILVEFDTTYLRETLLPALLNRDLGHGGGTDYHVRVVARDPAATEIYRTEGNVVKPDAEIGLFDIHYERLMRRGGPPGRREAGIRLRGPGPEQGRWLLTVQHKTGSLDAVVARARVRNLGVAGGIILLIAATTASLLRYTRQAQRLAAAQIDFVAGVSHELKTPLTVISTAAFNLRGRTAANPAQVERYGVLIQSEAEKLGELVDHVVRFASSRTGALIQKREAVAVETVLEDALEAARPALDAVRADVHVEVENGLPLVFADPFSLKLVIRNLLSNAAKYGTESDRRIGVSVVRAGEGVEIRVSDHGPGIPAEEKDRIFEPFFRGRRAQDDQIHGTGLGLSIVRGIVDAHEGSIGVESEPMKGTTFAVRIPAAPEEQQDEFTHAAG